MRFDSGVELGGETATGLEVPAQVVEALGAGRRPAVTVTVNGHSYRSTIAVMGGRFLLPLSAENRTASGLAAGDAVEVEVELDNAPRVVEVPPNLALALAGEPRVKAAFERLAYSHQLRHVLVVTGAKQPETRQRRVTSAMETLRHS